ncbi:MAG: hypothetical protein AABN33_11200 [Acidobacteriota bacterium]
MRGELVTRILRLSVTSLFIAVAATGMVVAPKSREKTANAETQSREVSFYLNRLPENPRQYSLVISDEDERTISGAFSVEQLQILRAIMIEAEKFAFSEEAVGTKEPITTRFTDKQERAFIIDVQKNGNQSQLFLTLTTEIGRLTMEAGRVIRGTRREEGFFFGLLSRLESLLPKVPAPPKK